MGETKNVGKGVPARTEPAQGKRLLDRAWDALLAAGFEQGAAGRYVGWMRQYVLHHGKRHPQDMGIAEIRQYLGGQPVQTAGGTGATSRGRAGERSPTCVWSNAF